MFVYLSTYYIRMNAEWIAISERYQSFFYLFLPIWFVILLTHTRFLSQHLAFTLCIVLLYIVICNCLSGMVHNGKLNNISWLFMCITRNFPGVLFPLNNITVWCENTPGKFLFFFHNSFYVVRIIGRRIHTHSFDVNQKTQ